MKKILLIFLVCVAFVATAMCQGVDIANSSVVTEPSMTDQLANLIAGWLISFATIHPTWISVISLCVVLIAGLSEYLGSTKRFVSNNVLQLIFTVLKKIASIFVSKNKNV